MSDRFQVTVASANRGEVVIELAGALDFSAAGELFNYDFAEVPMSVCTWQELMNHPEIFSITFDLRKLTFIQLQGAYALIDIAAMRSGKFPTLYMRDIPRCMQRIYEVTGMRRWYEERNIDPNTLSRYRAVHLIS